MSILRLATRASPLALWQAREAARLLRRAHPGLDVRLVPITSGGDLDLQTPLYAMGVVGVFCKEVQALVLAGRADAGVHSCKDLPTQPPQGLMLAALLPRADVRDALVGAASIDALPPGACIGTSSTRRRAQLAALRPDLRFTDLRGNVQTRLAKIARGEADATVMALAGLRRLGLSTRVAPLPIGVMTPAPAQGAIAIDCRCDDRRTRWLLSALDHRDTRRAITAERQVLAGLGGGCSLPLGCLAERVDGTWRMTAAFAPHRVAVHGPWDGLAARVLAGLGTSALGAPAPPPALRT